MLQIILIFKYSSVCKFFKFLIKKFFVWIKAFEKKLCAYLLNVCKALYFFFFLCVIIYCFINVYTVVKIPLFCVPISKTLR